MTIKLTPILPSGSTGNEIVSNLIFSSLYLDKPEVLTCELSHNCDIDTSLRYNITIEYVNSRFPPDNFENCLIELGKFPRQIVIKKT